MTRKIRFITHIVPKITKTTTFTGQYFATVYTVGYIGSVAYCSIAQPEYSPSYSFRRNLFDGLTLGLFVGSLWPIAIPILTYRYIKNIVDSDPIKPVK